MKSQIEAKVSERQCRGFTRKFKRCSRMGNWRLFCHDHWLQPFVWFFTVVSVCFGVAKIAVPLLAGTNRKLEHKLAQRELEIEVIRRDRAALQDKLNAYEFRAREIFSGLRVTADWARDIATELPEVESLARSLRDFETRYDLSDLTPADEFELRLARATIANAQQQFDLALSLVTEGDVKVELAKTEAQIDREIALLGARGFALVGLSQFEKALECFRRIIVLRPTDYWAQGNAATCIMRLGDVSKATALTDDLITSIENAEDFADTPNQFLFGKTLGIRGVSRALDGKHESALEDYTRAISIFEDLIGRGERAAELDLGITLGNRGYAFTLAGKTGPALNDYNRSIRILSQRSKVQHDKVSVLPLANTYSNQAQLLRRLGQCEESSRSCTLAIQLYAALPVNLVAGDVAATRRARAKSYFDIGQLEHAFDDLDDAVQGLELLVSKDNRIDLADELAESLRWRGIIQYEGQQTAHALADFDRAIELLKPLVQKYAYPQLKFVLCCTLDSRAQVIGDSDSGLDAAIENFDDAIGIGMELIETEGRTDYASDIVAVLCNRAVAHRSRGDREAAIRDVEQALELRNDIVHSSRPSKIENDLAAILNENARMRAHEQHAIDRTKAVAHATRACELTNWENASFLDTLGSAYAANSDFDSAAKWQEKALERAPTDDKDGFRSRLEAYRKRVTSRDNSSELIK